MNVTLPAANTVWAADGYAYDVVFMATRGVSTVQITLADATGHIVATLAQNVACTAGLFSFSFLLLLLSCFFFGYTGVNTVPIISPSYSVFGNGFTVIVSDEPGNLIPASSAPFKITGSSIEVVHMQDDSRNDPNHVSSSNAVTWFAGLTYNITLACSSSTTLLVIERWDAAGIVSTVPQLNVTVSCPSILGFEIPIPTDASTDSDSVQVYYVFRDADHPGIKCHSSYVHFAQLTVKVWQPYGSFLYSGYTLSSNARYAIPIFSHGMLFFFLIFLVDGLISLPIIQPCESSLCRC